MSATQRFSEWVMEQYAAERQIHESFDDLCAAIEDGDYPRVRGLAWRIVDGCDRRKRTEKPIAEWRAIVDSDTKEEEG